MNNFASITENGTVRFTATHNYKTGVSKAIRKIGETVTKEGGSTTLELHNKERAQELLCKLMGWTKADINFNSTSPGGVVVNLNLPANGRESKK